MEKILNITSLINHLRSKSSSIWVENDGISVSILKKNLTPEVSDFIKANKEHLIKVLSANGIFSEKAFNDTEILIDSSVKEFPLSPAQERLWFIEQYEQGTNVYFIPQVYELGINTDAEGIKVALQQVVKRHEVLRSTIEQKDENAIQLVHEETLVVEEHKLNESSDYHSVIITEINKPFDLTKEYPIRAKIYKVESATNKKLNKTLLLVNIHHIASDAWSGNIFEEELYLYYSAYINKDSNFSLPSLSIQYKDYALWQKSYLSGETLASQLNYWKDKLEGFQTLELPIDFHRPAKIDYRGSFNELKLEQSVSNKLRDLSKSLGVSMHSVMLSSLNILFSKYTGQNDIVIGSTAANRHHGQTMELIGFFINTQVNRSILKPSQNFEQLIQEVYQDQISAQVYQDLPFEKIVNELNVDRDSSKHPIFQVIFEMESVNGNDENLDRKNYLKEYEISDYYSVERFDLSIFIQDDQKDISVILSYATSLFKEETIARLLGFYDNLLDQLTIKSTMPYSEIYLLDFDKSKKVNSIILSDRDKLLSEFNNIPANYTNNSISILDLFNNQVQKNPDSIALIFDNLKISYKELDEKANSLSSYFRETYNISKGIFVGIMLDRSEKMLISVLAVLKAGGAYVPIDPIYPSSRKSHIINDAAIGLLITQSDYLFELDYYKGAMFAVDIQLDDLPLSSAPLVEHLGSDLAYVIYTSGSTGLPKGCSISHGNLLHYIQWANNYYFENQFEGDFGLYTSLSFDLTITSIFCTLSRGRKLRIYPQYTETAEILHHYFSEESSMNSIKITPSHIKLLEQLKLNSSTISCAIVGGESVTADHVRILKSINPGMRVFNEYGPTETTVGCIVDELKLNEPVLIGKPIYGVNIYILGKSLELLPIGIVGEICISGLNVGNGYLNQQELTSQKFVPNPFEPGKMIYRTGDLARWLVDGKIEYRGRNDDQVKIRGYRIETGEIKNVLENLKEVKQAHVLAKEITNDLGQSKILVAYYVLNENHSSIKESFVKEQLSALLPDYMVPTVMIKIDEFPLTVNGKIDHRALPDPLLDSAGKDYVTPITENEIKLCQIWTEVLKLDRVGITDDFFTIGGDSILSIRLVAKINQLGFNIAVIDVFKHRTIQNLLKNCQAIELKEENDYQEFSLLDSEVLESLLLENEIEKSLLTDIYPASYLQTGMLIESQTENSPYYNVDSFLINKEFDSLRFEKIWKIFVNDNEQLRTAYVLGKTGYVNVVYSNISIEEKIQIVNPTIDLESFVEQERKVGFNCHEPGLFRLLILTDNSNKTFTILFSHHHVIADGWSIADLFSKFVDLYSGGKEQSELKLPSYAKFIAKELNVLNDDAHQSFWSNYLKGYEAESTSSYIGTTSPTKRKLIDIYKGLPSDLNVKLLNFTRELKVSPDAIFLGAVNSVLSLFYNVKDLVIGTIENNRLEEIGGDKLFGLFLNTIPARFKLDDIETKTGREYVSEVFGNKLKLYEFKRYPYGKIKSDLNLQENIFNCLFNYVHFHVEEDNYENKFYNQVYSSGSNSLPLTIDVTRQGDEFFLFLGTYTEFMDYYIAEKIVDTIILCLDRILESPDKLMKEHSLVSDHEYEQIVNGWNNTTKKFDLDRTICKMFSEQVSKSKNHVALIFNNQEITYEELDRKSDQLAHQLITHFKNKTQSNFETDKLVALYLDRSIEMVIGILAVLKAGGAYVPIDIAHPQDRVNYMLNDTGVDIILSKQHLQINNHLSLPTDKIFCIDLSEDFYNKEFKSIAIEKYKGESLAYVIYTSGTTGNPKGVMINHHNLSNFLEGMNQVVSLNERDHLLAITSISFDISILELLWSLTRGITVTIKPDHTLLSSLDSLVNENEISALQITPSYLEALLGDESSSLFIESLKHIIVGGEKFSLELLRKLRAATNAKIYNMYGPTETTIWSTCCEVKPETELTIGSPIQNTQIYILDNHKKPVPVGVVGEMYIGGAGVARGYLNREDLTHERFIENKFVEEGSFYKRLYKTGDLAKWLPNGTLDIIGRNDNQVKIRGYRIELGEIEQALMNVGGIKQVCVLVKQSNSSTGQTNHLVGYCILDDEAVSLNHTKVFEKLSCTLPEYMIPSALVEMKGFPLNVNGKLDRKSLPDPVFSVQADFKKPATELEVELGLIYSELLGLPADQISIHRNFFSMGGNSILVLQLKHRLSKLKEFKLINVADLFKYNTIHKLIDSIQEDKATDYSFGNRKSSSETHEIAIIGMSGAFSGVNNIKEYWDLISNQREGTKFWSNEECVKLGLEEDLINDPNFIPVGGNVENIELFDPGFWEISPNEAKQLDPQIRKFIEHSWTVIDAAGYGQSRKKNVIGVFAGNSSNSYYEDHIVNGMMASEINMWEAFVSNTKDALATKTAYYLGLTGPANSINTACSTGLVSVVEACKSLQVGSCNMALAGAVSLSLPDQIGYVYEQEMIFSKDGHCRTFDKESSGTISGSGVAVVLLKRLEEAINDGDNIIGVIKGYATNNDGDRKVGYTAPSVIGQSECIISAQQMAGVKSGEIDYVECHGTATRLGDPIEVQALQEAFSFNNNESNVQRKTVLGAVKANIGHADSAAGTASLIKVCLMLRNKMIPGQANFSSPNPELQFGNTKFEVTSKNQDWLTYDNKQRLAGVSSFGIGGTNAHVIVGEYLNASNKIESGPLNQNVNYIIPVSAKSREALDKNKKALKEYLNNNKLTKVDLCNLAYTLQERKEHFKFRSAFSVNSNEELIDKLANETLYAEVWDNENHKIVFMFPGQGAQYTHMAKELYEHEVIFKQNVDECIALANKYLSVNLYDVIYPMNGISQHNINEIQWAPISLFTLGYSLSKFLNNLGINADAYIGHSFGEYVAATLSGVFNLEDAIKIVIERGRLMQLMEAGSMLAINANENSVSSIIKESNCEIGVINSSDDVVATGRTSDIERLSKILDKLDIPNVRINGSVAGHSKLMERAADDFAKIFETITLNKPTKVYASNLTGKIAGIEVTHADYWCKQLRNTVLFSEGIKNLSNEFNQKVTFLEVGTGKGLSYFVNKFKKANNCKTIQTVQLLPSGKEISKRKNIDNHSLINEQGLMPKLWMNGLIQQPNNPMLFIEAKLLPDLPSYQFDYQKCWIEKTPDNHKKERLALLSKEQWFNTPAWTEVYNFANEYSGVKFERSLVFLRNEEIGSIDFSLISNECQFVVLDSSLIEFSGVQNDLIIKVNPEIEDHFISLATDLSENRFEFDSIIHAASLNNVSILDEALNNSFYSLYLIRQFVLTSVTKRLIVLTNGLVQITNEDVISSANGTLVGAVRNINHELVCLDSRIVDIGYNYKNIENRVLQIANDPYYNKFDDLLAIKFGKLWIQHYKGVGKETEEVDLIKDGDTILITGGLGGVGLAVAEYFSTRHKLNLILVGRRNIFDNISNDEEVARKVSVLERIKSNGSSVDTLFVDISDRNKLKTSLTEIQKTKGVISGVVHTAGVMAIDKDIYSLTNIKAAFRGKVYGIENIVNILDQLNLKFVASTSSIASILGDVSRIEYCASNSFLDFLSADKVRFGDTNVVTVNLPSILFDYQEDGFAALGYKGKLNSSQQLQKLLHNNSFDQNENARWFYHLCKQTKHQQVVISKYDLYELRNELFKQPESIVASQSIHIIEETHTETEAQIAIIFCDVLGIDRVSINDDFFELGGNSILAIRVSNRISKLLNCDIKVAEVFKHKTIAGISANLLKGTVINIPSLNSNEAVLSFAQQRLWFIEQYESGTNAFNIPSVFELEGNTSIEALEYALQQIVARHEVLRSTIEQRENKEFGVQIVHNGRLEIETINLNTNDDYNNIIKEEVNRPFDLTKEFPMRARFYLIKSSSPNGSRVKRLLMINMHHIATDGWSTDIFRKELVTFYYAYLGKESLSLLPALEIQYKDYSVWQRSYLVGEKLDKQLNFWKEKLTGFKTLSFPTDYARPAKIDYRGKTIELAINSGLREKLNLFARKVGVSLNSVMLSGFNILLSKYTGQEDIVVGSPSANRHHQQTDDLIGFFINTQVCRTILNGSQNFEDLVSSVHMAQIEAQMYQDLPFEKLVDQLNIERDSSKHPVFQIIFEVVQGFDNKHQSSFEMAKILKHYQIADNYDAERFDMSVFIDNNPDDLVVRVSFATSLYSENSIERFIKNYCYLLDLLTENPLKSYNQLSLLNDIEFDKIVNKWNTTDKVFSRTGTIIDLFNEQVKRIPNQTAIVHNGKEVSYLELDQQSDKLAAHLITKYEIKENDLVALMLNRSEYLVIAMLAVLKAGAAYVAIDSNYPESRKKFITDDTATKVLITQTDFVFDLQFFTGNIFAIDVELDTIEDSLKPICNVKSNNLAYLIYTSGTTGKPKGVMVEHSSVVNYANNLEAVILKDAENIDFSTNIAFDLTVTTTICALLMGKKIFIYSGDQSNIDAYAHHLISNRIDFIKSTPSLLAQLPISHFKDYKIKQAFIGGEKLSDSQFNHISKYVDEIVDEYGPTETTVGATFKKKSVNDSFGIGKPYFNYKIYILDVNLNPVPVGVYGEIYIAGAGLARGYFNREDLTKERFILNPFSTDSDKAKGYIHMYKTGDLAKWFVDGSIDYIGRNDDQVKIRGYRVELGEIESALLQIEGIDQACVVVKDRSIDESSKYLVAYCVPKNNIKKLDETLILSELSKMVPEYMVPSNVISIDAFPLTVNGKLDKAALPNPEYNNELKDYVAPTNDLEKMIVDIWADVLGLNNVSTTDNFFRIGGDSILSIQVSSRIRQAGFACQVKDIFEQKTVIKLADYLSKNKIVKSIKTEQGALEGVFDLLPIQKWFFDQVERKDISEPNHWNQSFLMRVPQLEIDQLENYFKEIFNYHDMLRVIYIKQNVNNSDFKEWKQVYQSEANFPELRTFDATGLSENEITNVLTSWQSHFNLEEGFLFQPGYLYGYSDGSARIFIAMHHLIIDGVSWRILAEDLKTLFSNKDLPSKYTSYRQWVETLTEYVNINSAEKHYWIKQLKGLPSYNENKETTENSFEYVQFDSDVTKTLLNEASHAYHTEVNDLLLTALAYALKEINNQNVQGITLEGHGRENIDAAIDHSHTVGWFTSMYPVRLETNMSLKESIQFIKESLRSIPNKGIGFGAFATTDDQRNFSFSSLPPISFNYLGQFESDNGDWQITSEDSGDNVHKANIDHLLVNINGMVSEGKLSFSFTTKLSPELTKQMCQTFRIKLIEIVNHCTEKLKNEGSSRTPSDFKSVKVSQSLLDKLQLKVKKC